MLEYFPFLKGSQVILITLFYQVPDFLMFLLDNRILCDIGLQPFIPLIIESYGRLFLEYKSIGRLYFIFQ
jgi:hypothetical protein